MSDAGEILVTNHFTHWYASCRCMYPNSTVRQCSVARFAETSRLYADPWRIQNFVKLAPDSVHWRKEAETPYSALHFLTSPLIFFLIHFLVLSLLHVRSRDLGFELISHPRTVLYYPLVAEQAMPHFVNISLCSTLFLLS